MLGDLGCRFCNFRKARSSQPHCGAVVAAVPIKNVPLVVVDNGVNNSNVLLYFSRLENLTNYKRKS